MFVSLLAVIGLGGIGWLIAPHAPYFFGVILPLAAILVFLAGVVWRIKNWGDSPVPFRIPTTGGQQRSLDWIRPARLDSPFSKAGTVGRMVLEVLLFRSLFRNSKAEFLNGSRLVYWSSKWLWLFALAFHYCFLTIAVRHLRFFTEPVPFVVSLLETLDGIMQIGVPRFFMTDAVIVAALLFLLCRRIFDRKVRFISQPGDYFPLFLLLLLAGSGICLRYLGKADIASVKAFTMGLVTFSPVSPAGLPPLFFMHLVFVTSLLACFPFSKLMHMGGVFLSPTRNQANNSRAERHVNPWNPPKRYHTYAEYEDDFRDLMDEAGLPLEITPEQAAAAAAKE
jgi:nitrate reductase gamma subunit